MSVIALKDFAEVQYAATSRNHFEGLWSFIVDSSAEWFECDTDDVSLVENEEGEEIIHIRGEPKARLIYRGL